MKESWQDDKDVIACNEYMLMNELRTDMVFLVSNKERIGVKSFTDDVEDVVEHDAAVDDGTQAAGGDLDIDAPLNPQPIMTKNQAKRNMVPLNIEAVQMKAHSYVLSSRSSYFENEVEGGLRKNEPLIIEDVEPEAFKEILRYLYTNEFEKRKDLIMFILHGAKKFKIPKLEKECTDFINGFLVEDILPDELLMLADYSKFFEEIDLLSKCRRWIVRHSNDALNSANFCKISHETLYYILQAEHFKCEELQIFLACKRWAEYQCKKNRIPPTGKNIRDMLGHSLGLIHFPAIPRGEFVEYVSTSEILDIRAEEVKILRFLGKLENSAHRFEDGIPFHFNNRCYTDIGVQTISVNHDDCDLLHHNVQMDKEESKVLEIHIQVEAEIPTILLSVTVYNQEEKEVETPGEGEAPPTKVKYASTIELEVKGPCPEAVVIYPNTTPERSQPKPRQAKLVLGETIRLEARKKYEMVIKYKFNVPPGAEPVPLYGDKEQHFCDSFNEIAFYKNEKMTPFVEVSYKTF